MDTVLGTALSRKVDAALAALDRAVAACPASLWTQRLWPAPSPGWPPRFGEFWYVAFHALVWLDCYRAGGPPEEFAPPAPFAQGELDSIAAQPDQPYEQEEIRAYLTSLRQQCRAELTAMTDDQARRPLVYPWTRGEPVSYLELQLYNLRHLQEHAAQLHPFLGQRAGS